MSRQLLVPQVPEPRRESVVTPVVVDQSQPQPHNSYILVEQMRLMMQGMLSGIEARLSSSMKASVVSLRSDLVTERAERVASLDQINARLDAHETRMAALEAVPQSSGQRGQPSGSSASFQYSPQSLVVGFKSKDPIYKDDAMRRVCDVMSGVDGFVSGCEETMPLIPKVVFCEFASPQQLNIFLRTQKDHLGFEDMWASPNRSPLERAQEKPFFKIKRAICEIAGCDGKSVIINKQSRKYTGCVKDGLSRSAMSHSSVAA